VIHIDSRTRRTTPAARLEEDSEEDELGSVTVGDAPGFVPRASGFVALGLDAGPTSEIARWKLAGVAFKGIPFGRSNVRCAPRVRCKLPVQFHTDTDV
jgi:hypothetical protein